MMRSVPRRECRALAVSNLNPETDAPGRLPLAVATLLREHSQLRRLARGEALYEVGSAPAAMYGVLSGSLAVSVVAEDGGRFLAGRVEPGQWFGEVPLLDGGSRVYRAVAERAAEVAVLPAARFELLIASRPDVLLAITRLVCARYRMALGWIEDAALKPLPVRLATRLLASHALLPAGQGLIHMPQDAMAAQLGSSRQSINRLLKQWEAAGWLALRYGGVELRDVRALESLGL